MTSGVEPGAGAAPAPQPPPKPADEPPAQPAPQAPEDAPPSARARARTWATATPYRLPFAVALVGLVISAPFGGWRTAESETLPVVAATETVEAAPFEITLERAYYSPQPSPDFPELPPGQQYVVVIGTVTARHDASVPGTLLTEAVTISDLTDLIDGYGEPVESADAEPDVYSAQDSTLLRQIGPDLTYDIGLVYRTAATDLPDEVTLALSGYTWREDSFTREQDWRDPSQQAVVSVPLAAQEPAG